MNGWLARIGLDRPELRAWAMYDWANSAFWCTIVLAVFPPFFADYAAADLPPATATARFAWATTIAVNTSLALARTPDTRPLLIDLDLNSGLVESQSAIGCCDG